MNRTSPDSARTWSGFVPAWVFRWIPAATFIVAVIVETVSDDATVNTISETTDAIAYLGVGMVIGILLGSYYWPVFSATAEFACAALMIGAEPEHRQLWTSVAAICALWAVFAAAHRRVVFQREAQIGVPRRPSMDELGKTHVTGWHLISWVIVTVLAIGAIVGAALTARDVTRTNQFRSRATEGTGTVIAVDNEDYSATVDADGQPLRVALEYASPEKGETVALRWDGTGRAELIDDPFDPYPGLIPTGAAAAFATAFAVRELRRRARMTALVSRDSLAATAYASEYPSHLTLLWAHDEHGRILRRRVTASSVSLAPLDDPDWPSFEDLDDEQLLDFADTAMTEDVDPPVEAWHETPVTVFGLGVEDGPWLATDNAGGWRVLAAEVSWKTNPRKATLGSVFGASPATRRGRRPTDRHGSEHDAPQDAAQPTADRTTRPPWWFAAAQRTGRVGPFIMAPLLFVVFRWLGTEDRIQLLFLAATLTQIAYTWARIAAPQIRLTPRGLLWAQTLTYLPVPWPDVMSVICDSSTVVIRFADNPEPAGSDLSEDQLTTQGRHRGTSSQGVLIARCGPNTPPPIRGKHDPQSVVNAINEAKSFETGQPMPRFMPTPATTAAALTLVSCAVGLLLA